MPFRKRVRLWNPSQKVPLQQRAGTFWDHEGGRRPIFEFLPSGRGISKNPPLRFADLRRSSSFCETQRLLSLESAFRDDVGAWQRRGRKSLPRPGSIKSRAVSLCRGRPARSSTSESACRISKTSPPAGKTGSVPPAPRVVELGSTGLRALDVFARRSQHPSRSRRRVGAAPRVVLPLRFTRGLLESHDPFRDSWHSRAVG
jgi:hypothetical protein